MLLNTFRTFWLVFLACHSLNKSCVYYKAAPDLGENNEEIFESLGFTKEQLEAFRAEGVIN